MRVCIAGCGDLGTRLGQSLIEFGYDVTGIRRRTELLPSSFHGCRLDLNDTNGDLSNIPPADMMVYTAAAATRGVESYRATYIDGLTTMLEAARLWGGRLQQIFFVSSTSVYGEHHGAWVDEDTDSVPLGYTGSIMREAEALVANYPVKSCSIRFGGIYGPDRTFLVRRIRSGEARRKFDDALYSNRIHIDDCVGTLLHLIRLSTRADTYVAVDDHPVPYNEVLTWLSEQLGREIPERGEESGGRVVGNKRCFNQRLRDSGYEFRFPSYREGYGSILQSQ